jgi:uncharacterized protein YciI
MTVVASRSGDCPDEGEAELATVYVLVMLRRGPNAAGDQLHTAAHEEFISSLIRENRVLLGGSFATAVDDADAAYVLACSDVEEARRIAAEDPLAEHGVVSPDCVEWQLVGVDSDAIDPADLIRRRP